MSALNAPEGDVDIEGLGDSSATKKLDFDSGEINSNTKVCSIAVAAFFSSFFYSSSLCVSVGLKLIMCGFSAVLFCLCCVCCLLYTSPSPRDQLSSRMPSSA